LLEQKAQTAAEGWGGDYYIALREDSEGQGVLVLATAWDTVRDAHEFYSAFRDYGDIRFGERTLSSTTRSIWESRGETKRFGSWRRIQRSGRPFARPSLFPPSALISP